MFVEKEENIKREISVRMKSIRSGL